MRELLRFPLHSLVPSSFVLKTTGGALVAAAVEERGVSERLLHLPKASLTMLVACQLKTSPAVASRRHRCYRRRLRLYLRRRLHLCTKTSRKSDKNICSDAASVGFKMSPQA
jgi:hypothetical protein